MALKDNLVAHWSLEEASGSRADDHGSNTLTSNNSVGTAAGKVGQAAQFVAASSQYLSIADNAALSMGDIDFTIGAWVYLDAKTAQRPIFGKFNTVTNQREYYLSLASSSDRFRFDVSGDGITGPSADATTLGSPALATWYFVVAWHDSTANTINIQVNNGAVDSVAHSAGVLNGTAEFRIGGRDGSSFFMAGRIDQAFVVKRVLATQERTSLYNGGSGLAFSQWSGTYTLSGSALAGTVTGSGAGLINTIPLSILSASATASAASGSGAGLVNTNPVYSLSGTASAAATAGSGVGLAVTAPVYSVSGSVTAQVATGSGAGLLFLPLRTLSGSATAGSATGSGVGLVWVPDLILSQVFTVASQSSLFTVPAQVSVFTVEA